MHVSNCNVGVVAARSLPPPTSVSTRATARASTTRRSTTTCAPSRTACATCRPFNRPLSTQYATYNYDFVRNTWLKDQQTQPSTVIIINSLTGYGNGQAPGHNYFTDLSFCWTRACMILASKCFTAGQMSLPI